MATSQEASILSSPEGGLWSWHTAQFPEPTPQLNLDKVETLSRV